MTMTRKPKRWKNKGKKRGYKSPPSLLGSNMKLIITTNKGDGNETNNLSPIQQQLLSHHTRGKNPNNITIKENK